jgi:hypothetical protein
VGIPVGPLAGDIGRCRARVATGQDREAARVTPSVHLGTMWIPGWKMSLSPDSKSLAATAVRQSGDIWLMENFETPPLWQRIFRQAELGHRPCDVVRYGEPTFGEAQFVAVGQHCQLVYTRIRSHRSRLHNEE